MSLLEQNITKKGQIDKNKTTKLTKLDIKDNNGEYNVKAICDSAVYTRELKSDQLQEFYYPVFWKGYLEEKNIWETVLAIQHLKKLINSFYKKCSNMLITTFEAINIALLMTKPIIKPIAIGPLKKKEID